MSALRKVLVVDDDPVVATSFNRVLTHDGYIVVTASNGAEALEKLSGGEYDVVYTDIKMPGMDGLELAEKVKAQRSWTPVVIITGYGTEANEQRAKAAGVSAFLHKPLSPEMIEASARQAIETAVPPPVQAAAATVAASVEAAIAEPVVVPEEKTSGLMFAAKLVAGPVLGFFFAVLLPFIGLATLIGFGAKAFVTSGVHRRVGRFLRDVSLFFAAPFIGLAYIVLMPFFGIGALVWTAVRGADQKETTN